MNRLGYFTFQSHVLIVIMDVDSSLDNVDIFCLSILFLLFRTHGEDTKYTRKGLFGYPQAYLF